MVGGTLMSMSSSLSHLSLPSYLVFYLYIVANCETRALLRLERTMNVLCH